VEALPPILIGSAVAAIAVFAVRRVLRRRRARAAPEAVLAERRLASDATLIVIGIALMVLSVTIGQRLLDVEEPPRGELFPAGVGIASDVKGEFNRNFTIGLAVTFIDCDDPVNVTIGIAGTAEYFEDNEIPLSRRTDFTVTVPSEELGEVTVGHGGGYFDVLNPLIAKSLSGGPLRTEAPVERQGVTIIRGSMEEWSSHLSSLVVQFKAHWLIDRGLGTCYLKLPPLVGTSTIIGAQVGPGRTTQSEGAFAQKFPDAEYTNNESGTIFAVYDRSLAIHNGLSVVQPGRNDILKFEPSPNTIAAGLAAIACSQSAPTTGDLGTRNVDLIFGESADYGGGALRNRAFAEQTGLDCSGLVTLAEAGASSQRDLVLLIVGAVFSLGAALVLEIGLDIQRRRIMRRNTAG
jgi:hypothetical protein